MFHYIVKRLIYSVLIIAGVMVLTFLLFRVAAGDPAAALLGKNPSPEMVERLRTDLGSDKPLFWGHWKRTEAFSSITFDSRRDLPGLTFPENAVFQDGVLFLRDGTLAIRRNFQLETCPLKAMVEYSGSFLVSGKKYSSPSFSTQEVLIQSNSNVFSLQGQDARIRSICFFRRQVSPFDSQFFDAVGELVSFQRGYPYVSFFNFGRTITTNEPVRRILARGIWPSLFLMLPIFFGELFLGIVLALFATAFKGGWIDRFIVILSVAGMSVSYLVFIIFGQWYLGYYYNFFPVWGYGTLEHLLLPVIIGIVSGLGGGVRFYRTVFVNELNREYLKAARARGCGEIAVFGKHLLKNAAVPIISRASTVLPFLFTGSLLLETFFGIPGLGYAGINALNNSDLQMVKALVLVGAVLFVSVNLLADIAYAWVDPRIRLHKVNS